MERGLSLLTNMSAIPAMQLVCNYLLLGAPRVNVTDSVSCGIPSVYKPRGYIKYPDIGVAYKLHKKSVSWIEAKNLCTKEGAQLALIDSLKKLRYVRELRPSPGAVQVGIIRMYDDEMWVSISTGSPLSSLPWAVGEPWGEQDCVMINGDGSGLVNNSCDTETSYYVCEIPILRNDQLVPS